MSPISFTPGAPAMTGNLFEKIVAEMDDGIIIVDAESRIVYCNRAVETIFGAEPGSLAGQSLDRLLPDRFRGGHSAHLSEFRHSAVDAQYMGSRRSFIVGQRIDGEEFPLGATILKTAGAEGPLFVAVVRDISERVQHQKDLERLANTDPLTGLLNRRAFARRAEQEIERLNGEGVGVAVALFDLDKFKSVNDTHGHETGDAVICDFADLIMATLSTRDIAARWGGEEFILLMPETTVDRAAERAELIRRGAEMAPFAARCGLRLDVTISAGVVVGADNRESLDDLIRRADHALYAAKNSGRNRVISSASPTPVARLRQA